MTKTACVRRDQGPAGSSSTTTAVSALKTRGTIIRTGTMLSCSRAGSMRWFGGWLRGKKLSERVLRKYRAPRRGAYRLRPALKTSPGGRRRTGPPPAPFNSTTFLIKRYCDSDDDSESDSLSDVPSTWDSLEAATFSNAWDTCTIDE